MSNNSSFEKSTLTNLNTNNLIFILCGKSISANLNSANYFYLSQYIFIFKSKALKYLSLDKALRNNPKFNYKYKDLINPSIHIPRL